MQENDQSRRAGRPSLLTEEAPAEDNNNILSKLDYGKPPPPPPGTGGPTGRVAGIAAAVALTGGALGWMLMGGDEPSLPPVATVASPQQPTGGAALVVPTAGAAPVVSAAAGPGGSDVSAATILDGTPARHEGESKSLGAAVDAPTRKVDGKHGGKDELLDMLDKPHGPSAATVIQTHGQPVVPPSAPAPIVAKSVPAALEPKKAATHAEPGRAVKPKGAPVKLARADKDVRKDKTAKAKREQERKRALAAAEKNKSAAKSKAKAKPAAKASDDTDVALLAALLTHTKKAPANPKASEYQKCSTLETVAAADRCRERVCAAGDKAPTECKSPRVAKTPS